MADRPYYSAAVVPDAQLWDGTGNRERGISYEQEQEVISAALIAVRELMSTFEYVPWSTDRSRMLSHHVPAALFDALRQCILAHTAFITRRFYATPVASFPTHPPRNVVLAALVLSTSVHDVDDLVLPSSDRDTDTLTRFVASRAKKHPYWQSMQNAAMLDEAIVDTMGVIQRTLSCDFLPDENPLLILPHLYDACRARGVNAALSRESDNARSSAYILCRDRPLPLLTDPYFALNRKRDVMTTPVAPEPDLEAVVQTRLADELDAAGLAITLGFQPSTPSQAAAEFLQALLPRLHRDPAATAAAAADADVNGILAWIGADPIAIDSAIMSRAASYAVTVYLRTDLPVRYTAAEIVAGCLLKATEEIVQVPAGPAGAARVMLAYPVFLMDSFRQGLPIDQTLMLAELPPAARKYVSEVFSRLAEAIGDVCTAIDALDIGEDEITADDDNDISAQLLELAKLRQPPER